MYQPDMGVTMRVRCRNHTCKAYREMNLVKMPRQGDVVLWSEPRCIRCLSVMEVVNKEITRMVEAGDDVGEAGDAEEPTPTVVEPTPAPVPPKPAPPRPPRRP